MFWSIVFFCCFLVLNQKAKQGSILSRSRWGFNPVVITQNMVLLLPVDLFFWLKSFRAIHKCIGFRFSFNQVSAAFEKEKTRSPQVNHGTGATMSLMGNHWKTPRLRTKGLFESIDQWKLKFLVGSFNRKADALRLVLRFLEIQFGWFFGFDSLFVWSVCLV